MLVPIIAQIFGIVKFTKWGDRKLRKPVRIPKEKRILCKLKVNIMYKQNGWASARRAVCPVRTWKNIGR